jgi:hypothetical protein
VRQLHVLGVSDDGATLLLGSSDNGKVTHRVPLDDRLRAAVRGQLAAPGADRVESALPPREIQARLRAGETPEAVAKAAGVPLARVVPYAAPVIAERQRIVDEARAVPVTRPRGPKASRPLGEAVDAKLAEVTGFKADTVEWGARRRPDGTWVVTVSYAARGGRRSAAWRWHPTERELTADDLAASRLAADDTGGKRKRTTRPDRQATRRTTPPVAAKRAGAAKPAAKRSTAKRAAKPTTAPRPVEAPITQPEESDTGRAGRSGSRVPVPSWSDVLLGVAPPREDTAARQDSAARQDARPRRRRRA